MILTNRPDTAAALLGPSARWRRISEGSLPDVDRAIWAALSQTDDPWGQDCPGAFWRRLFLIDEAPRSQFDALRDLLSRESLDVPGHPRSVAALALSGKGFHGQRGRNWAAEGGNLHLSAVVAPGRNAAGIGIALTMLPAVAACDAIAGVSAGRLRPEIKWVNDVLLSGQKVAGVLTATQVRGSEIETAIFGIGMNVERAPEVPPTPFVPEVGSLKGSWTRTETEAEAGSAKGSGPAEPVPLAPVVRATLAAIQDRYETLISKGPEDLFHAYISGAAAMIGQRVRIYPEGLDDSAPPGRWPEPDAAGILRGIRPDLGLILEGHADPVLRGRLALEDPCRTYGLPPSQNQ